MCAYMRICIFIHLGIIIKPPENKTVCINGSVTINCGYGSNITLPVVWIINGTSFTQEELMNSYMYQLNNHTVPLNVSLTIISIMYSVTVQCLVQSNSSIASSLGTINVTCKYFGCTFMHVHMHAYIMCTHPCVHTYVRMYYTGTRNDSRPLTNLSIWLTKIYFDRPYSPFQWDNSVYVIVYKYPIFEKQLTNF